MTRDFGILIASGVLGLAASAWFLYWGRRGLDDDSADFRATAKGWHLGGRLGIVLSAVIIGVSLIGLVVTGIAELFR